MTISISRQRLFVFSAVVALTSHVTSCRNGSSMAGAEPPAGPPTVPAAPGVSTQAESSTPRPLPGAPPELPKSGPDSERRVPPKLGRDDADALTCRVDADCVITCRSDGSCCLEQCGCSMPMSRPFLDRLEVHLARECGPNPLCPMAGCVGTKLYEPRCHKGQCVAVKQPGGV
jgi:hypothetical protein